MCLTVSELKGGSGQRICMCRLPGQYKSCSHDLCKDRRSRESRHRRHQGRYPVEARRFPRPGTWRLNGTCPPTEWCTYAHYKMEKAGPLSRWSDLD